VLAVAAVASALYLVWRLNFLLLLLFAALLLATLLTGLAGALSRATGASRRLMLAAAIVAFIVLPVGGAWLFGQRVAGQFLDVFQRADQAIDAAGDWIGVPDAAGRLSSALASSGIRYVPQAASMGYGVLTALSEALLVVVGGVYLAVDPALYRSGLAKLFPPRLRPEVLDTLNAVASALRLWCLGQLFSMVLVGTLSAVAFWAIGLPIPLALGSIAGLTNFLPLVGPFVGAVPAILFAFTQGLGPVAWTVGLIVLIQQVDGNIASPLIQRHVVALPPALLLFALVGASILFGWLGLVLAAPLTVAAMVIVQKLWVREAMGAAVKLPGE
jgi:predicted PurR-regulated permease PerM